MTRANPAGHASASPSENAHARRASISDIACSVVTTVELTLACDGRSGAADACGGRSSTVASEVGARAIDRAFFVGSPATLRYPTSSDAAHARGDDLRLRRSQARAGSRQGSARVD